MCPDSASSRPAPSPQPSAPTLHSHFADAFPELSAPWQAQDTPAPTLLHLNTPLAEELGLDAEWLATDDGVRLLTGERPGPHARPVAQGYAGHQFGGYSPRLGDGRALLLGELTDATGRLRDLHLKGSGLTPYSRPGSDGQAAVGPMLRELVVSEAMHALGIPTTRALAVVGTGATVPRERPLPGAVLARVADSHLRVGTFQYASALVHQGQAPEDLLERLARTSLERHHPGRLASLDDAAPDVSGAQGDAAMTPARALLEEVVAAQARLVAQWMAVGFVHGVMNTDNVAISGQTIDYGPCAFLDTFDPHAVFSSIDRQGRYAFGAQPQIALWNLNRFAETLLPLLAGRPGADPHDAVAAAEAALRGFAPAFDAAWQAQLAAKLGLSAPDAGDLGTRLLPLLQDAEADWTAFWAGLTDAAAAPGDRETALVATLLPGTHRADAVRQWFADWRAADPDAALMRRTNPRRVPRNAPLQEALDAAEGGDLGPVREVLAAVARPFDAEVPGVDADLLARLEQAPAPGGAGPFVTYCGT